MNKTQSDLRHIQEQRVSLYKNFYGDNKMIKVQAELEYIRQQRLNLWNELFSLPFYRYLRTLEIYAELNVLNRFESHLIAEGIGRALGELIYVPKLPKYFKNLVLTLKATSE